MLAFSSFAGVQTISFNTYLPLLPLSGFWCGLKLWKKPHNNPNPVIRCFFQWADSAGKRNLQFTLQKCSLCLFLTQLAEQREKSRSVTPGEGSLVWETVAGFRLLLCDLFDGFTYSLTLLLQQPPNRENGEAWGNPFAAEASLSLAFGRKLA